MVHHPKENPHFGRLLEQNLPTCPRCACGEQTLTTSKEDILQSLQEEDFGHNIWDKECWYRELEEEIRTITNNKVGTCWEHEETIWRTFENVKFPKKTRPTPPPPLSPLSLKQENWASWVNVVSSHLIGWEGFSISNCVTQSPLLTQALGGA